MSICSVSTLNGLRGTFDIGPLRAALTSLRDFRACARAGPAGGLRGIGVCAQLSHLLNTQVVRGQGRGSELIDVTARFPRLPRCPISTSLSAGSWTWQPCFYVAKRLPTKALQNACLFSKYVCKHAFSASRCMWCTGHGNDVRYLGGGQVQTFDDARISLMYIQHNGGARCEVLSEVCSAQCCAKCLCSSVVCACSAVTCPPHVGPF